ncbi:MAG TPA: alkaline phosphatase family protein [Terriglobales bacterium]|jgi:hypothetical protein|nr:alkaline phosphatase family protein [Terriglobales bacterium]
MCLASVVGCGSGGDRQTSLSNSGFPATTPIPTPTPAPTPPLPTQHGPVVLVLEENHGFSSVIGSSAMPYLNSLAQQGGLATQYYANTHPSIGNYFMFTTGQIITNDDGYSATVNDDNLVRHLLSARKTWRAYAEDLPATGYTGGDAGAYSEHHNPFSYFSDVRNSSTQKQNLVGFSQFQADLGSGKLPDFSFVLPNMNDDAHNGSLAQADAWLQQSMTPLLASSQFQNGGLLIVVFDEAEDSDGTHGGGRIAMVMAGPNVKSGFQSSTLYQHQNLLKTITTYMGVDGNIGAAASAASIDEFLK